MSDSQPRAGRGRRFLLAAACSFCGVLAPVEGPGAEPADPARPARPAGAGADPHGHGEEGKPYDPADYTQAQRERIDRLFTLVICNCPKENFTKTLAGCPDGCADHQKQDIRAGVKAGKSDQQILDEQVMEAGTKEVLSLPDSRLAHLVPYLALGVMAMAVLAILVASVRPRPPAGAPARESFSPPGKAAAGGPRAQGAKAQSAKAQSADPAEESRLEAAVERDLAEMDE